MAKNSDHNNRSHLRYRDPDSKVANLAYDSESGERVAITTLVVNESFSGMACVYVGDGSIKSGDQIYWLETSNIETKVNVIRAYEIAEDVYYLALKII